MLLTQFSRKGLAAALEDVAAHARLVENVKALQEGQKELADAVKQLSDRLTSLQADIRVLKAETKLEAAEEATKIVAGVQGAFFDRLGHLGTRMALIEAGIDRKTEADSRLEGKSATTQLPAPGDTER